MIRRAAPWLLLVTGLLAGGCARHVVVERDSGRVDGDRSITSRSDLQWNVSHEPAAGVPAAR